MDRHAFEAMLWGDFVRMAPQAATLRARLEAVGETVVNDHVAFRTFDLDPVALDRLEPHLLNLGWVRHAPYAFEDKKLRAYGYVHGTDEGAPRIFLSELQTGRCSPRLRAVAESLVAQVPPRVVAGPEVFASGRPWAPIPHALWQELLEESEYAAWLAAIGFRANHFTVLVNALSPRLRSIPAVLDFVEAAGFRVNTAGGRVKGTPADLLEQGSTLADVQPVAFADGTFEVPTGYYEFALRHPLPDGSLYPGFVAASADRIFESTHARA